MANFLLFFFALSFTSLLVWWAYTKQHEDFFNALSKKYQFGSEVQKEQVAQE